MYAIVWNNGHATGTFPERYDDYDDARDAAEEWRVNLIFCDPYPDEAIRHYSYLIVEADDE